MKEGWIKAKLEDICEVNYGTRVVQKIDGGTIYPVYGGGGATFRMDKYNREDCLIVSRSAMLSRRVIFVKGKCFSNDGGLTVGCKCNNVKQDFLDKHILALNDKIYSLGKGVAQKNLDIKELKQLVLCYPSSITEQEIIVAELDCLSGVIEKQKQQLKELDNLAQAIFYDMFGDPDNSKYPKIPLCLLSKSKLSYGSGASAVEYDNNIRYIRITDIQEDGKLNNSPMSPSIYDEKYLLNDGDILFARSGATVGKTYLYTQGEGTAIYAGYLIRFVPNKEIVLPEYVFYFTRSEYYKAFIEKNAQAVAQPNINAKQYGDLMVCVPPLSLQQEFASKIEAIEKQKELIKQSLSETETLFNSRMDYYFN